MPILDLAFTLQGNDIPVDHGYHVFAAASKVIPSLHQNPDIAIHPIFGSLVGNRRLMLTAHSFLTIRLPHEQLPDFIVLAGKSLSISDRNIRIGIPRVFPLKPSAVLSSRLVTIKGFLEPVDLLEAVQRQLDQLNVRGTASLVLPTEHRPFEGCTGTTSPFIRRTIRIKDAEVVGFAIEVSGLSADDSIRLQESGIGGRRRMGCGVFTPRSVS